VTSKGSQVEVPENKSASWLSSLVTTIPIVIGSVTVLLYLWGGLSVYGTFQILNVNVVSASRDAMLFSGGAVLFVVSACISIGGLVGSVWPPIRLSLDVRRWCRLRYRIIKTRIFLGDHPLVCFSFVPFMFLEMHLHLVSVVTTLFFIGVGWLMTRQGKLRYAPVWVFLSLIQSGMFALVSGQEAPITNSYSVVTISPSLIAGTQPTTEYLLVAGDDNRIALLQRSASTDCRRTVNLPLVYLARPEAKVISEKRKATVCAFIQGH
jgi:hypothetical protein